MYTKIDLFIIHVIKEFGSEIEMDINVPGKSWKTTFTVLCAPRCDVIQKTFCLLSVNCC